MKNARQSYIYSKIFMTKIMTMMDNLSEAQYEANQEPSIGYWKQLPPFFGNSDIDLNFDLR